MLHSFSSWTWRPNAPNAEAQTPAPSFPSVAANRNAKTAVITTVAKNHVTHATVSIH